MTKKFIWCVQSAKEYPHLDAMKTDRSDALGLTFKERVDGYLFGPGTTHATGRNMLYEAVKDKGYEYICFTDDDAVFQGMTHEEGFRKFESLIDEFHPAIASPRYPWHLREHLNLHARVQGCIAFDFCMNAVHRDLWWVFFPLWSEFDSKSWWNAAHVFNRIAAALIPGGMVQFNEIAIDNPGHAEYPREDRCRSADNMIAEMLKLKHLQWPHETPDSFKETTPFLRDSYTITKNEVGRYFDLTHPYWRDR